MGIYVHLAIVPERVSAAAWHAIYDRARRVAQQWTPRPLSLAWRQIGAVRVAQYTLDIEGPEGLHIVGDAETLTTGESFRFPAQLATTTPAPQPASPPATGDDDVLVAIARRDGAPAVRLAPRRNLFGSKTQGLPYHALIVALGLLVEHSLPGTAVVYGDLSPDDGEAARRGVAAILGEALDPPVVMDAARLRRRLAASLDAEALDHAISDLGPPDPHTRAILGDVLGLLTSTPRARLHHELEHVVHSCPDPARLGEATRQLLRNVLEVARSAEVRGELRERIAQWGAIRTREALARTTIQRNLRLTSTTWDAIESADLDELAFLFGVACIDTTRWDVHHAVRAMLENRALRRA